MANLSEDIQCAGSDTRPPMLDKTDFASWQQRIRLYCRGKENGVNILKSIDEGPFQMGTTRVIVAEGTEGSLNLGPERPRVYSDLSQDEKDRYNADIRATNIILQGLPKDIYSLINHYTDAKDIWDNVKMLLEGSELTKEDRESQLYDDFEHFRQNKGETIHDYYVRFVTAVKLNKGLKDSNFDQLYAYLKQHEAHANENKMMLERLTQQTVDPLALMSNVSPQHYHSQSSTIPPTTYHQPHSADTSQSDLGLSPTDNLIENLTNTLALLTQSYKTFLPQINNQLRTSSNLRNQATVQDGKVQLVMGEHITEWGMLIQDNAIDEDVDEQPVQDLALNVDNVFQADDCDAYDYDVDEALTAQTMFMANLSSADPIYNEAGPSYDSDILSEVHHHDHFQDAICEHHEEHRMQDDVQPSYVVHSHADYTSDSNMTSYDQYVKDNAVPVVQNNASTVPNDMFELTEREQKIDEQLRIVICDRNIKEENLKKELHSVKLQLASTIQHNKLMVDEVTSLKKDFNQKENKYLEEFLDLKALKDKVEDKLFKQGQSIQTVHMMCKPRSYYDEVNKVAIGYKNPLCLHRARQVQPALYSGHVIVTPNHAPAVVRDGEETLELTEISRKKMHDKMKANECVDNKVNITPPNYSKENFLATFTPQKQLTPEQIFWSQDIVKMKAEALKEQNTRPIKALTVYPPNTPATLVPRVLPTKSQVKINIFTLRQLFSEFEKTCKKRITPTGITEGERGFEQTKTCYLTEVIPFFKTLQEHFEGIQKALTKEVKEMSDAFDELEAELDQSIVDRKHDEIERKNLLIEHDNIIADGLSKEVFYVASNSELNVSRFTEMQKAHNVVKARCLELEAELSNLRDNIHKDNYNELLNRFSNLEVNHLNLQLKYQNLKESFQNKPSSPVNDTPDFNSVFVIGQMKASLQGKDNVIQKLKMQISQLKETRSELDQTLDFRARDFQISQLTEKVNGLQEQNELFRAENEKIKQHFKELYDAIKITRAKHTEQITALKNENGRKYAIDVEPIPPRNRNNREVHLVYLRHLKESVDTLREIVEEAKVERPLDRSLAFACRYTKHSQELLEYVFGTCPKVFNQQDKKHAHTPRKKQVTFEDQIATSSSTTHKHVEPMHTQKSNVPVPPSTGVNSCTDASGSQPRSILKKHRIPPAKSDSLEKVEDHSRTIRSSCKTTNRVDSSISSKRTVINSNSHSVCQTCNKCLFSANHDMCVVTYLHSVNASPKVKNAVRHVKQVWKPKQVTHVGKPKHIKQVWKPKQIWKPTGKTLMVIPMETHRKNIHPRKHSCYVRDTDGVELLKGSRGSNLYTISVEEMMKSSLIACTDVSVATACYTQNCSLIYTRHDKTPYELVHNKKPDLTFFRVFGALCYPTNDSKNLGKLQPRADIGIFIGYAPSRKGYRIYNKRTRQIMETIHVQFDELTEQMAPVQSSPGPAPNLLTPGPISSGLVPNPAPALPYVPPTNKELEMLFQPMFDEYFNPPGNRQDPIPNVVQDPVIPTGPSVSISIDLDAPSGSHISSPLDHHSSSVHHGVAGEQYAEVNPFAAADPEPFVNVFAPDPTSEASSSREIMMPELNQSTQPHEHIQKWTDSHPLDNIIRNPSRPVSTRKQLATNALWCFYNSVLSKVEPKNFKSAATKDCWFQAMQEEIHDEIVN
ncbi:retrovirus-related pol polyprotein from transposon TNT 1-94 [Tanacetum coccineum]